MLCAVLLTCKKHSATRNSVLQLHRLGTTRNGYYEANEYSQTKSKTEVFCVFISTISMQDVTSYNASFKRNINFKYIPSPVVVTRRFCWLWHIYVSPPQLCFFFFFQNIIGTICLGTEIIGHCRKAATKLNEMGRTAFSCDFGCFRQIRASNLGSSTEKNRVWQLPCEPSGSSSSDAPVMRWRQ